MPINRYTTKKGVRYRARFKHQNQVHEQSGFRTKKSAREWIAQKRLELKKRATQRPTSGAFSALAEAYLDDHEGRFTFNTLRQKSFVFSSFIALEGDLPLDYLSRAHIKSYLQAQHYERGGKAANRDLRDLHALFRWAQLEGKVTENPARHIEDYPEDHAPRYVPPIQDVAAVLLVASREQQDLLEAYCNTAARMGEILQLKKSDVDLQRGLIWVSTKKRKGGEKSWRSIAMNKTMRAIVERRMGQSEGDLVFENPRTRGPYGRNQHVLKFLLTRLCKKANVKPFTVHALRHFASAKAAAAYEKGELSLRELQKLLGHQRLSTTEIYIESLKTDTGRVVDVLERPSESVENRDQEGDNG